VGNYVTFVRLFIYLRNLRNHTFSVKFLYERHISGDCHLLFFFFISAPSTTPVIADYWGGGSTQLFQRNYWCFGHLPILRDPNSALPCPNNPTFRYAMIHYYALHHFIQHCHAGEWNKSILFTSLIRVPTCLYLRSLNYKDDIQPHLISILKNTYRGAGKSLAQQGRKQATATEDFYFHMSYL
jgi:hypothetical protein